jgi:hypothetical protein
MTMSNTMTTVDQLRATLASISTLKKEAEGLKSLLISEAANVPGTAWAKEGEVFRACVSWADKAVVDYKSAFAELQDKHGLKEEFIVALLHKHTRVAPMVPTVRVSARKTS